jgi:hypothetical protein
MNLIKNQDNQQAGSRTFFYRIMGMLMGQINSLVMQEQHMQSLKLLIKTLILAKEPRLL